MAPAQKKDILVVKVQSEDISIATPLVNTISESNAWEIKEELAKCIPAPTKNLVLNMEQVGFLDSSGVGLLLALMKRMGGPNAFALCNVPDRVMRLFQVARLDNTVLRCYPNLDEAVASFH